MKSLKIQPLSNVPISIFLLCLVSNLGMIHSIYFSLLPNEKLTYKMALESYLGNYFRVQKHCSLSYLTLEAIYQIQ